MNTSLLLLLSFQALASEGSISLTDVNGLTYAFNDDVTYTSSSASGAASDASYTGFVSATTVDGARVPSALDDAFDGYNALVVNGTFYTHNGASALECSDRQAAFAVQTIGNLEVSRKVFVPADAGFARWMNVIKNVGVATETVVVTTNSDLGSDEDTLVKATSSGDSLVDVRDDWVVSMQAFPVDATTGATSGDVRMAHIWQNALGVAKIDDITFVDGDEHPTWQYTIDLAPGQTAIFLHFVAGTPTWALAQTAAETLSDLPVPTTSCMTVDEWAAVVNFGVDCSDQADDCNDATFDVMSGACIMAATNEGGACDDGTDCTVDDGCTLGTCDGTPAPEDVGTEVDANCDMRVECYADADGDGFRTDETITSSDVDCADAGEATSATPSGDCDDADATSNPDGTEVAGDGVDQDCSGADLALVGDPKAGCGCDTSGAPQGSMLVMFMGATVLLRRKARRA